jgi:hypothetical protein
MRKREQCMDKRKEDFQTCFCPFQTFAVKMGEKKYNLETFSII